MTYDFKGKIALVTGASRGIGAALALDLSKKGAHVVALARSQGALEELDDVIQAAGCAPATLIPMDLTKFGDIDKLGASLYERFGRLDLWFSCAAALGQLGPAHHVELKDLERVMRLNFTANTRLIRSLDPLLRASDVGARALFLTHEDALRPDAYWGVYGASKAALEAYVHAYGLEVRHAGVSVCLAHLPYVRSGILDAAYPGGYQGDSLSPQEVLPKIYSYL